MLNAPIISANHDSAFPGLATLINPEAFGDVLCHAIPGLALNSAKLVYARYTPGKKPLIGYRLTVNENPIDIYAKPYPLDSAADKLAKARSNPGVSGPLGAGRLALDEIATVVSVYPNDDKIRTLSLLADNTNHAHVLEELFPERPDLWQSTAHHLKYIPEKRAVLRLDCSGRPSAALKLYKPRGYETACRVYQRFTSRGATQSRTMHRSFRQESGFGIRLAAWPLIEQSDERS